jgi:hypothetical protein
MRHKWTKASQYLIKYKQKLERVVKKSDERDEKRDDEIKCNGKQLDIDLYIDIE